MKYVFTCWMKSHCDPSGYWRRKITFPCFPFPGLVVGAHKVKRIYVCQGNLDGQGQVEVEFKKTRIEAEILEEQDWKWEDCPK